MLGEYQSDLWRSNDSLPGQNFYTMLRVPNHHVFTEFERILRGRDFLLLTLADLSRSNYSMLRKILLHVDCTFHMQLYIEVGVNSEVT